MQMSAVSARKVSTTPTVSQSKTALVVELNPFVDRSSDLLGLFFFGSGFPPGPFWTAQSENVSSWDAVHMPWTMKAVKKIRRRIIG